MSEVAIGSKAPAFSLPSTGGGFVRLSSLRGSKIVIYFYPRDNTPGCSKESADFAAAHPRFEELGTIILGVSQDSITSHDKFKAKLDLPFDLLCDEAGVVSKKYGCMKLKKLYGREFLGIERSTFLIDEQGRIKQKWLKVKVPGHVDEVMETVTTLA